MSEKARLKEILKCRGRARSQSFENFRLELNEPKLVETLDRSFYISAGEKFPTKH